MQKILTELQNRNSLIKIILSDTKTAEFKKNNYKTDTYKK